MTEFAHWQDTAAKEAEENKNTFKVPDLSTGILAALVIIAFVTGRLSADFNPDFTDSAWWSGFLQNFSTEMMGAIITFGLFELVLNRRKEIESKTSLEARQKRRLQILVGSRNNAVAVGALDELRAEGWLEEMLQDEKTILMGASWENAHLPEVQLSGKNLRFAKLEKVNLREAKLERANLSSANLEGANLRDAKLEGANLRGAKLEGAYLIRANLEQANLFTAKLEGADLRVANLEQADLRVTNLEQADLMEANLESANLRGANLEDANLMEVNLEGADLSGAKLAGTNLSGANLEHANIHDVQCDENTILPDGTKWTEDIDWSKFGAVDIADRDKWLVYLHQHGFPIQHYFPINSLMPDISGWLQQQGLSE